MPSKPMTPKVEEHITALNRALFMRESQKAARVYEDILAEQPDYLLAATPQYDLARLLELGSEPRLALQAYEKILVSYKDHPQFQPSLRGAGHIAYRLKSFKKCRAYLERFIATNPPTAERVEAEALLERLPDGKGLRPAEEPSAGSITPDPPTAEAVTLVDMAARRKIDEESAVPLSESQYGELRQPAPDSITPHDLHGMSTEQIKVADVVDKGERRKAVPPTPPPMPKVKIPGTPQLDPEGTSLNIFGENEYKAASTGSDDVMRMPPAEKKSTPAPQPKPATPKASKPKTAETPSSWAPGPDETGVLPSAPLPAAEFALLLPIGQPLNVEGIVAFVCETERLPADQARRQIIERKGLLREKLRLSDVLKLAALLESHGLTLRFTAIDPILVGQERHDVLAADILEPGLRLRTTKGVKKIRWESVRLVSCGRLDRQPTVDLFCKDTLEHYRLRHPQFGFDAVANPPGEDENQSCRAFLTTLLEHATNALTSHTVQNLLSNKTWRPQKFPSEEEYRRYLTCLLLTHFGREVTPEDLVEASGAWE